MPNKTTPAAAKQQLADILVHIKDANPDISNLLDALDDKKFHQLLLRLVKDIENEHWSSTGAQQTIQATINVNVVRPNG